MQISLSPNAQRDDVWQAVRTLLTFWNWRDRQIIAAAQEKLGNYLGQPTVLISSGRAAIASTLRAFNIGAGDEVIIQAFTCVSVPAAVTWAGATPVFADIEENTYNLDPRSVAGRISARTRAIIVQHTFGLPADWTALQTIAHEHGIVLIEDCAHALGATYQGKLLGTLGDAAIFSFGRDKMVSSVFGGAVTSKDPRVLAVVRQEQNNLPLPPAWWTVQQLMHPILMSLIKPLYFTLHIGKALLVIAQRLHLLSRAVTPAERTLAQPTHVHWRFSPALATLLSRQIDKVARFTAARRENAAYYQRMGVAAAHRPPASQPAWLRYPLCVQDPASALKKARDQGLLLGDWYQQPVFPLDDSTTTYPAGSCPVAETAARSTINLPTMPTLREAQRERVIAFLKREHLL